MPMTVAWHIPNKVLLVTAREAISREDVGHILVANRKLVDESQSQQVHVIYDAHQVTKFPSANDLIRELLKMPNDDRFDMVVIVGIRSAGLNLMMNIASRFAGQLFRTFKTTQEATKFLGHYDKDITLELSEER